jgi:hypothetical protein
MNTKNSNQARTPEQIKGEKIINALRNARCKWCGELGVTRVCRCKISMALAKRHFQNWHPTKLAGPIGFLP